MKRWIPVLVLLLLAVVVVQICRPKKEVPIVASISSIGLVAKIDELEEKFRWVTRNLVYENRSRDPDLYMRIVAQVKIHAKEMNLNKTTCSGSGGIFALDGIQFSDGDIVEGIRFSDPNGGFSCCVYNGGYFVLVVLDAAS